MDTDGKNVRRVTNDAWENMHQAWCPDGKRIAFISEQGNEEICVIDVDGKNLKNLTKHPADDRYPAWSPGS